MTTQQHQPSKSFDQIKPYLRLLEGSIDEARARRLAQQPGGSNSIHREGSGDSTNSISKDSLSGATSQSGIAGAQPAYRRIDENSLIGGLGGSTSGFKPGMRGSSSPNESGGTSAPSNRERYQSASAQHPTGSPAEEPSPGQQLQQPPSPPKQGEQGPGRIKAKPRHGFRPTNGFRSMGN